MFMWVGITTPLCFLGAYYGYKKRAIEHPGIFESCFFSISLVHFLVRTNPIPRHVPEQVFYTRPIPGIIMGGILPFGRIFIQLFFILNSLWSHQIYYMFGFLLLGKVTTFLLHYESLSMTKS